jgi:hypothetical protein
MTDTWKIRQIEIKTLGDLSGNTTGRNIALPDELVTWLCEIFPDTHTEECYVPPPPGSFGLLLPCTKVVLKVPHFLWGVVQSVLSAMGIFQLRGDALNQALLGLGLGNALHDIRNAFVKLKEHEGQYCCYSALMNANFTRNVGFAALPRTIHSVWQEHQKLQDNCPVTSCRFHQNECILIEVQLEQIIKDLCGIGVVKEEDGSWRIIF